MTQATHTPFTNELSAFRPYGQADDRWQVAPLHDDGSAYGAITGNNLTREQAHCLAAAPDMLAALEAIEAYEDAEPSPGTREAEIAAMRRAAIAKARGEG